MYTNKLLFSEQNKGKKAHLNQDFNQQVFKILNLLNEEEENRLETYHLVIQYLIFNKKLNYIHEIKYRISEGEDKNEVILSIITRDGLDFDGLVWLLKKRIEEYIDEDFMDQFYY